MNYKFFTTLLTVFLAASLTGCTLNTASDSSDGNDTLVSGTGKTTDSTPGSSNNTSGTTPNSSVLSDANVTISYLDGNEMFTDRDKEIGYEENTAITINLADNASSCSSGSVTINDNIVTIVEEATYLISGSLSDGQLVINADDNAKIHLVLNGASINSHDSAALYIKNADKVFITLALGTFNSLQNSGAFTAIDDNNIDGAVFSKADLTMNGSGTLSVASEYGHGIVSKDDLVFTGGNYQVAAASSALSGKDSIRIADGNFHITAGKDAIHSENVDDTEKGFIYISGGNFTLQSGSDGLDASGTLQIDGGSFTMITEDDGFHSDCDLIINDGNITITECYEGLEGQTVTVNGGFVSLASSDDGLNAAGGNDQSGFGKGPQADIFASNSQCLIAINGGSMYIQAGGDGIDSNGNLLVTGGEIYVSGPENSGNGSLDYAGEAIISGGIFVAAGNSGMAMNFSTSSTQGSMLVTLSEVMQAGTPLSLKSSDGEELLRFTPQTAYNCAVLSSPDIKQGETYTLTAGDTSATIEMTSLIYGSGGMGGRGGMGGHGNIDGRDGINGFDGTNGRDGMDFPGGMKDGGKDQGHSNYPGDVEKPGIANPGENPSDLKGVDK